MKKLSIVILSIFAMVAFIGCGETTTVLSPEAAKFVDNSAVEIYSMDLSDIDGYQSYIVTNGTWAETYDVIINLAKRESDGEKRTALYHKAEDLLMSTGTIVPLYYYTDIFMASTGIEGLVNIPNGTKLFKYTTLDGVGTAISVCLASEPDTIDPALNSSVDGAIYIQHAFSGLLGYDADGQLVPDLAASLPTPVENEDGTVTYTFELRSGLKWSDGTALTAADFVYAWNRAVDPDTAADYSYLFAIIDGADTGELNISAVDATHFAVTLVVDVPYFFELCAFPTFMPVQQAAVEAVADNGWATEAGSYVTSGAYTISSWTHGSNIVMTKNPQYWNAAAITMEQITFYLSDDDAAILSNYINGTYDFIDSLPNDEIQNMKTNRPNEFNIEGQLGTYYIIFNNNSDLVPSHISADMTPAELAEANEEIRYALSLLIDRNYIVTEIGQAGQLPASSFVSMGITNFDGSEFYEAAGSTTDAYNGYFDTAEAAYAANCAEAVEILSKYFEYDEETGEFTNFATFNYLFNTSTGHQAIGEYLQSCFAAYGIAITMQNQEWGTFLNTRKNGEYVLARNGWLADYNDPINMLDMWTTDSGNNDAQLGK
ncbi:MAG: ABC transporter substrate-binding protein [Candidatus Izemoplasmatales bacterium]